jgi:hypothetical protein
MLTYYYIMLLKSHHPNVKIQHFHAAQQILGYHISNTEDALIYAAFVVVCRSGFGHRPN